MPDRVLNTLLEDRPQYDRYAMTVMKGRKPELRPGDPRAVSDDDDEKPKKKKTSKKGHIIEVDPGDVLIIQVGSK